MRHRRATLAIAALTLLGVAACGDDSDKDATPATPAPSVSVAVSGDGTLGSPGDASSAPESAPPTEGTSPSKPPKKGGAANQGPAGKAAAQEPPVHSSGSATRG